MKYFGFITTFWMLFISATLNALTRVMDKVTATEYMHYDNQLLTVFTYIVVGSWSAVIVSIIGSLMFGKFIDKDFKGVRFNNVIQNGWSMFWWSVAAGTFASLGTLCTLYAQVQPTIDPATITVLGSASVVYIALWELTHKQIRAWPVIPLVCLIWIGGILFSWNKTPSITAEAFIFVFIGANIFNAISERAEQRGVKKGDSINLFIWRFITFALCATIMATIWAMSQGILDLLINAIWALISGYWWWLLPLFIAVFLSGSFRIIVKKEDIPLTYILSVLSVQIIFALIFTLIFSQIWPKIIDNLNVSMDIWTLRVVGLLFLVISVAYLKKTMDKQKKSTETTIQS